MSYRISAVAIVAAIVLTACSFGEANAPQPLVKVGVVRSLLRNAEPELFKVLAGAFSTVVKLHTTLDGELRPFDTADDIRRGLENGELQLGVMSGIEFGWMKAKQPNLAPLMLNDIDPEALESLVVVRGDSGVTSLKECRGKKVAIPASTRFDTKLFLSHKCQACGLPNHLSLGETVVTKSVEEALDQVVDGEVGLAAVERSGMRMFERRKPARHRKLAILDHPEKFPPSVIVYHRNKVDEAMLKQFRDGMGTAHNSTLGAHLMKLMNIRQFAAIRADFQQRVDQIAKAYPQSELPASTPAFELKARSK